MKEIRPRRQMNCYHRVYQGQANGRVHRIVEAPEQLIHWMDSRMEATCCGVMYVVSLS